MHNFGTKQGMCQSNPLAVEIHPQKLATSCEARERKKTNLRRDDPKNVYHKSLGVGRLTPENKANKGTKYTREIAPQWT